RARATNAVVDGAYSLTATATTPAAATVPAAPTGMGASAISPTQVNLAWTAAAGATGHKIERCTDGVNFVQIALTSSTTYSDTAAAASTSYTYRVRGTNAVGDGAYSSTATATTPAAPAAPLAPSNPLATAATSGAQITLTWTDNS